MTTETTTEKPGISAAIIVQDGKVLMVRRRISEGELLWQFPAGAIEPGESSEKAAVRETLEETRLIVSPVKHLGERVHPKSGRLMSYTACEVVGGTAIVGDDEELDAIAWVGLDEIPKYVPYGLFGPVQDYLNEALSA